MDICTLCVCLFTSMSCAGDLCSVNVTGTVPSTVRVVDLRSSDCIGKGLIDQFRLLGLTIIGELSSQSFSRRAEVESAILAYVLYCTRSRVSG